MAAAYQVKRLWLDSADSTSRWARSWAYSGSVQALWACLGCPPQPGIGKPIISCAYFDRICTWSSAMRHQAWRGWCMLMPFHETFKGALCRWLLRLWLNILVAFRFQCLELHVFVSSMLGLKNKWSPSMWEQMMANARKWLLHFSNLYWDGRGRPSKWSRSERHKGRTTFVLLSDNSWKSALSILE